MLDECVTKRASHLIIDAMELYKHEPPIQAEFLEEHFSRDGSPIGKGAWDVDWARTLEEEGDWSVITCDSQQPRGERARLKGPPLHLILPARHITGFFMSAKVASYSGFEKFRAVIYLFPKIVEKLACPHGTRFKIIATAKGSGYEMMEWPPTETLPVLPTSPRPPSSQSPSSS
jgi:hypothetical protein